jgi:hypothetical protein
VTLTPGAPPMSPEQAPHNVTVLLPLPHKYLYTAAAGFRRFPFLKVIHPFTP